MPTDKRIFLSHASADKALADLLRNTLVLGGVGEGLIFYSSGRGTGIPSGEDVGTYLRRSLRDAGLVVSLNVAHQRPTDLRRRSYCVRVRRLRLAWRSRR